MHVTATYDGSSKGAGSYLLDGELADVQVIRMTSKDITYGGNEPSLAIGYRFRDNGFKGGTVDEFRCTIERTLQRLHIAAKWTLLSSSKGRLYYRQRPDAACKSGG